MRPDLSTVVAFKTGESAEMLPGISYGDSKATLVLYIRSTCRYCTASMPVLRDLRGRNPSAVRWVAVSDEPTTITADYLRSNHVAADVLVSLTGRNKGTPTILLVGRDGVIKNVWVGQLTEGRADDLRDAMTRASS